MSKKQQSQIRRGPPLCVYCGVEPGTTKDHVIPECLFVPPLPPNMLTVPACPACNNDRKSLNDTYLRDMLVLDLAGSQHPVAQALFAGKVIRAVQGHQSVIGHAALTRSQLKPLYSPGGVYLGEYSSIPLEEERVAHIFATIVRGLYYRLERQRLPQDCVFELRRLHPLQFRETKKRLREMSFSRSYQLGSVFVCGYMKAAEDPALTYWVLCFYDKVFFTVKTYPAGFDLAAERAAHLAAAAQQPSAMQAAD